MARRCRPSTPSKYYQHFAKPYEVICIFSVSLFLFFLLFFICRRRRNKMPEREPLLNFFLHFLLLVFFSIASFFNSLPGGFRSNSVSMKMIAIVMGFGFVLLVTLFPRKFFYGANGLEDEMFLCRIYSNFLGLTNSSIKEGALCDLGLIRFVGILLILEL